MKVNRLELNYYYRIGKNFVKYSTVLYDFKMKTGGGEGIKYTLLFVSR